MAAPFGLDRGGPLRARDAAMLFAAVLAAFAPGLGADFVFDDSAALASTVRPLLAVSYSINRLVLGNAPLSYRALNVLLHALAACLVAVLLARALRRGETPPARAIPLVGATLWALHPATVETVTCIAGRSTGLSSVFLLGAFLLATGRRERGEASSTRGAAVLTLLAVLTRETSLVMPALVLLWGVTLGHDVPRVERLRAVLATAAGSLAAAALLAFVPRAGELLEYSFHARGPLDALRGNVHAITAMAGLWSLPWRLSIDPAAPPNVAWADPATLVRGAGLASITLAVFFLRRRWPATCFAAGWTLLAVVPTNSVVWRLDPVGVRPLYLASIGPVLGIALLLRSSAQHLAARRVTLAGACAVVLALGTLTIERNAMYRSPVALWSDAAAKAPDRARPLVNLALALLDEGQRERAHAALVRARDLEPWDREARCLLLSLDRAGPAPEDVP